MKPTVKQRVQLPVVFTAVVISLQAVRVVDGVCSKYKTPKNSIVNTVLHFNNIFKFLSSL